MSDGPPPLLETASGLAAGGIVGLVVAAAVVGAVVGAIARRFGRRGSVPAALVLLAASATGGPVAIGAVAALLAGFGAGVRLPRRRGEAGAEAMNGT